MGGNRAAIGGLRSAGSIPRGSHFEAVALASRGRIYVSGTFSDAAGGGVAYHDAAGWHPAGSGVLRDDRVRTSHGGCAGTPIFRQ